MRDLVLAEREFSGSRVIFAVRDLPGNINHRIKAAGFDTVLLHSDSIEELISLVIEKNAETVVLDHYGIGIEEEKKLKKAADTTLFVLDDLYEPHYCDTLLNHNIYAVPERYRGLVPPGCIVRCGPAHTLVRKEFDAVLQKNFPASTKSGTVFVAMGGSDHSGISLSVLKVLERFGNLDIDIVTTSANTKIGELRRGIETLHNRVRLHIDSDSVAQLMGRCRFGIVTPSVVLNEMFYLKKPFIAIQTVENQREMVDFLEKEKLPVLRKFDADALESEVKAMFKTLEREKK